MELNLELWIQGGILLAAIGGLAVTSNHHNDKKRARIYERIDEIKTSNEETYMKKEVCEERAKQLDKIEKKVECIPEMKANLELLVKGSGLNERQQKG